MSVTCVSFKRENMSNLCNHLEWVPNINHQGTLDISYTKWPLVTGWPRNVTKNPILATPNGYVLIGNEENTLRIQEWHHICLQSFIENHHMKHSERNMNSRFNRLHSHRFLPLVLRGLTHVFSSEDEGISNLKSSVIEKISAGLVTSHDKAWNDLRITWL